VGCGQCAIACPTGALAVPGFDTPASASLEVRAVDCWRVPAADSPRGTLRVPCLGGLSPAALLELTAAAERSPVGLLDRGFCGECPAGGEIHPMAAALAETQRLLAEVGIAPERWPRRVTRHLPLVRMADSAGEPRLDELVSRRALLVGFAARLAAPALSPPSASADESPVRPRPERERLFAALEQLAPDTLPPARLFPKLTAGDACANHRICASACPTPALRPYRGEGACGISFAAAACVSCGLCVALCPEQALTLSTAGDADTDQSRRALTRFTVRVCPDCGADHQDNETVCPACRKDQSFARDAFQTLFGATIR
jgi:ferredoxin